MFEGILRRIAGRCDVHDRSSAVRTAHLEEELGFDPQAVSRHQRSASDFVDAYADPNFIDCGRSRCRDRRAKP